MKYIYIFFFSFLVPGVFAQKFSDYFENKTLRIDYIFAGNQVQQQAYVHQLVFLDQWHGRKVNLSQTPIQGNGQIRVIDPISKQLIYIIPFSSLFQEWLTLEESRTSVKSFENSFLIPFPKNKVVVEVVFFDKNNREYSILKHDVEPQDILIRSSFQKTAYQVIHAAQIENPIKIAIISEGYQTNEMDLFLKYAYQTVESMWQHSIFAQYKDYFEISAVFAPSTDSGISQPSQKVWLDTAVGSHFDTFYSLRYLTTPHVFRLHQWLENIPYQHIIILANTSIYGGGGILNSYTLTTTKNPNFSPVVVHEFGHSFGGLADEYFYPNDVFQNQGSDKVEPWEKNITTLAQFYTKWKDFVDAATPIPTPIEWNDRVEVGAFEGLEGNGIYIPTWNCRMKRNDTQDFCSVCSHAIEEMILFYTSSEN